jgi:hypothetical protein
MSAARPQARAMVARLIALAAVLAVDGCQRGPRYTPVPADTTAVRSVDSLAVDVRSALTAWEQASEDAAPLTAALVLDDLRRHPDRPREERAGRFLDSLSIGYELESDGDLMLVNLFARAAPDAGAWPFLFWGEGPALRYQAVEGQSLRLLDIARHGADGAAILYGRRSAHGVQPLVMTWTLDPAGRWQLGETLGPDSLGGVGDGRFESGPGEALDLVTRTWEASRRFDECPTCPHVMVERRLRWDDAPFRILDARLMPTPYTAFVAFADALADADRLEAERWVVDPTLVDSADALGWGLSNAPWRVAPGTTERAQEMVVYRGRSDAYELHFVRRGNVWAIQHLGRTARRIE